MHVVYITQHSICIRLKEKMVIPPDFVPLFWRAPAHLSQTLAILGQYDVWVKRGVVSIMGAKLNPSPTLHRVHAPSTHPIPTLKSVYGAQGFVELEIISCFNGPARLRTLNPIYRRITNSTTSVPRGPLRHKGPFSFSIVCNISLARIHRQITDMLHSFIHPQTIRSDAP